MKRKTIMVLSSGTATAWNMCNAIRNVSGEDVRLIACDINPAWLVHSSVIADLYIQVPPIASHDYYSTMLEILSCNNVDILIPMLDMDIQIFSADNDDLARLGVFTTAPDCAVFNTLSNKRNMYHFLVSHDIPAPQIFSPEQVSAGGDYFIKPVVGVGSRNVRRVSGAEAKEVNTDDFIIQELCTVPEITVDCFCYDKIIKTICRERIETKAGVCTKARIYHDNGIERYIIKLSEIIKLPAACNVQFMTSASGEQVLTDFNLRLGGGSALSAAVGFKLAQSAVSVWLGLHDNIQVEVPDNERYVLRHYSEVVTK